MRYTSYVINNSGATETTDSGTSIRDIYDSVRCTYGKGWLLHVIDEYGVEVLSKRLR